ncbi:MAG: hypothetical protein ACO28J_13710, partial [Limnohabitans sp.]
MSLLDPSVLAPQIDPASLAALPRTSGVYIFKGDGTLPLYIGKSVDLRSREAAIKRFGASLRYSPQRTIGEVFSEVSKHRADYG